MHLYERWPKIASELSELSPVPVYVRTHYLLTTGDATPALKWGNTNAYTEEENGNPVYDWTITDRIFDTSFEKGMKPLVEIGFISEALSSKPEPYKHNWHPGAAYSEIFAGWAYPPKDYKKWKELVFQWVNHCVGKYGKEEVETCFGNCGTSRISVTCKEPKKNTSNCMIILPKL